MLHKYSFKTWAIIPFLIFNTQTITIAPAVKGLMNIRSGRLKLEGGPAAEEVRSAVIMTARLAAAALKVALIGPRENTGIFNLHPAARS